MQDATRRRLGLWLPIIAGTAALILWLLWPRAVAVDFVRASRGPIEVSVSDEGETRISDVYLVAAPVAGLMHRIPLKAGDEVIAGRTLIARIEPGDPAFLDQRSSAEAQAEAAAAQAAQRLAAASVERAAADADFAAAELQRHRGLAAAHTIAASELDAAEHRARAARAALEEARAGLRMRESELARAQARLMPPGTARGSRSGDCDCIEVFSPVSGRLLRLLQESEAVVGAGTALVEIGDPAQLEIVLDLLSTEAVRVRPGQPVRVEGWGGTGSLAARVRRVEPSGFTKVSALGIEEQRVNVIIDFSEPPERWRQLGHGYRVEPRIILAAAENVLKVPRAALFRDGDSWAVFVRDGGRARLQRVELGLGNSLEAEVVTGLGEGEEVIMQPGGRVAAGSRVRPRD